MAKKKNVRTYKRGNTWTYSYEMSRVAGKRKTVTKGGFTTEDEAYKAGMAALADYVNGLKTSNPVNISYGDFLLTWLNEVYIHEIRETSYISYLRAAKKHVIPALGNIKLVDLTVMHVKEFLNLKKQEGYSKKSIQFFKMLLTRSLEAARIDYAYINSNPAKGVPLPKIESNVKKEALSKDTIKKLFDFLEEPNDRLAVMIGLHCGLRIGEVFALEWSDIDMDKQTINIDKQIVASGKRLVISAPKSRTSNRCISFDNELLREFKKMKILRKKEMLKNNNYPEKLLYEDLRDNGELGAFDFIFRYPSGRLYQRYALMFQLRKFSKLYGEYVHFHLLRHTHCTDLLAAGAPLTAIQKRLGHASILTTMDIYASSSNEQEKRLKDILNNDLYAI